ncbi:MAG: selenocysteine-specific translation elongation factor [Dehalococcoidales bacterium]|nr:selenocysteine-specific translation elongation factor [Dehalococcoidales bacterium]
MYTIGTAGHVDHGKSTLIQALTGIDPDRLREEKERGMTIDLGFAWLSLPGGQEISIVDVPGHERFIKNMLAGVGGIDLALLVVAADEGVMPQTEEHLAILDLLRVKRGVVALTKKDLVDEEWLEMVAVDVEECLGDTVLAKAPIIPVSSTSGEGLPELIAALERMLADTPPKKDIGRPRLPIDRVFTLSGFGTVVTGTLIDGKLQAGQDVEILPQGLRSRVRGLQTHRPGCRDPASWIAQPRTRPSDAPAQGRHGDARQQGSHQPRLGSYDRRQSRQRGHDAQMAGADAASRYQPENTRRCAQAAATRRESELPHWLGRDDGNYQLAGGNRARTGAERLGSSAL